MQNIKTKYDRPGIIYKIVKKEKCYNDIKTNPSEVEFFLVELYK